LTLPLPQNEDAEAREIHDGIAQLIHIEPEQRDWLLF
jgi:hypothetical protein